MSLLVITEIRCKYDGGVSRFEYSFGDYVIKGYSFQDNVQVTDEIRFGVYIVQYHHPDSKKVIIQSYSASGFVSQELILFIFNMKTRLDDEK